MKMKALSVRQPFAWLICAGIKDVENRSRATKHRGPILIHAGKAWAERDLLEDAVHCAEGWCERKVPKRLQRGGFVGVATITEVVEESESEWFAGPVGYVLTAGRHLPFEAYKGKLGLFEVEIDAGYLRSKAPKGLAGDPLPKVEAQTGDQRYVWRF
jgi:ASCH domain